MSSDKIHFPLIDAVCVALTDIFERGYYADKVIERVLKSNPKMGSKDRAFVAETTYDVVRWWRLLNHIAETDYKLDRPSLLRLLSSYFFIFKKREIIWKENHGMSLKRVRELFEEAASNRALRESIPDWLDALGAEELGAKWDKELAALNKEAEVSIRVNTLKTDKEELKFQLSENGIETLEDAQHPDALILKKRSNIFRNGYFLNGHFEVQDKGSQEIAMYLQVEPGMRVIDACAGAGGKTLHLAALMQNKGRIISMDVEARKLDELRKRASRAGAHIIETRVIESSKTIKRLESSADRVLLDVPCSGLGTLRRNPDAKWKLSPEFISKIKQTQQEIIRSYSRMVKPGGLLVYATCSVLPSEDEQQVSSFLSFNPNFSLQKQQYVLPSEANSDGFYMALLRREA